MKKLMLLGIRIYASMIVVWYAQMIVPNATNHILTENKQQILNVDGIEDPLRDGAYSVTQAPDQSSSLDVVSATDKIGSHQKAQNKTMAIVKNIINYALWMVALIALVYLIYHGFLMVTASGDDTQYKQWLKGIKFATIAIVGIWTSWLIVSLIFWLLALFIWT